MCILHYLSAKHDTVIQYTLTILNNVATYIIKQVLQISERVFWMFCEVCPFLFFLVNLSYPFCENDITIAFLHRIYAKK